MSKPSVSSNDAPKILFQSVKKPRNNSLPNMSEPIAPSVVDESNASYAREDDPNATFDAGAESDYDPDAEHIVDFTEDFIPLGGWERMLEGFAVVNDREAENAHMHISENTHISDDQDAEPVADVADDQGAECNDDSEYFIANGFMDEEGNIVDHDDRFFTDDLDVIMGEFSECIDEMEARYQGRW